MSASNSVISLVTRTGGKPVMIQRDKTYSVTRIGRNSRSITATAKGTTGVLNALAWVLSWNLREQMVNSASNAVLAGLEQQLSDTQTRTEQQLTDFQAQIEELMDEGAHPADSRIRELLDQMEAERRKEFDAAQNLRRVRRDRNMADLVGVLNQQVEAKSMELDACLRREFQGVDLGRHLRLDISRQGSWTWAEVIPGLVERTYTADFSGECLVSEIIENFS